MLTRAAMSILQNTNRQPRQIILSDGSVRPAPLPVTHITVPAEGRFVRVVHDWETNYWNYEPRPNVTASRSAPETCQLWPKNAPEFYQMNEQYQRLWFDLIEHASHGTMAPSQLLTAWANVTAERKALTDQHGRGHFFRDFILEEFMTSTKNMYQKSLTFGGSLLKVVSKGTKYYTIECLNMNAPVPPLDYILSCPWLYGWLTEIRAQKQEHGGYVVSRWPDLKAFGGWGVPYIIIGNDFTNRVLKTRCIEVENGATYSIYN